MLEFVEKYPNQLREHIFEQLFEIAEIAKFSKEEADAYEESLKSYRDLKNSLDTAFEEGMEKGIKEVVKNSLRAGLSIEVIASITGLGSQEIENIRDEE